jgi:hypothetical protein
MVQDLDIARWRLRTQHLVTPHAASARGVVGSLLAVQAENPNQAAWAVAARTRQPDQADLARLLDEGAVLRTHVLRPTWHFVEALAGRRQAPHRARSNRPSGWTRGPSGASELTARPALSAAEGCAFWRAVTPVGSRHS